MKSGDVATREHLNKISNEIFELSKKAFPKLDDVVSSNAPEADIVPKKLKRDQIRENIKQELDKSIKQITESKKPGKEEDATSRRSTSSNQDSVRKPKPKLERTVKETADVPKKGPTENKQQLKKIALKNNETLIKRVKEGTSLINKALSKLKEELEIDLRDTADLRDKDLIKQAADKVQKESSEVSSKIPIVKQDNNPTEAKKDAVKQKESEDKRLREPKPPNKSKPEAALGKAKPEVGKVPKGEIVSKEKIILSAKQVLNKARREIPAITNKIAEKTKLLEETSREVTDSIKGRKPKPRPPLQKHSMNASDSPVKDIKENKKVVGKKVARKHSGTILTQVEKIEKAVADTIAAEERRFKVVRKNVEAYIHHTRGGIIKTIDAAMVLSDEICSTVKEASTENVEEAKSELQKGFEEAQAWIQESAQCMLQQITEVMDEARINAEKAFDKILQQAKEVANDNINEIKSKLDKDISDARKKASESIEQTRVEIDSVVVTVRELSESVLDKYRDIKDTASSSAFDTKEQLKSQLLAAKNTAKESFEKANSELTEVVDQARAESEKALEDAKKAIDCVLDVVKSRRN